MDELESHLFYYKLAHPCLLRTLIHSYFTNVLKLIDPAAHLKIESGRKKWKQGGIAVSRKTGGRESQNTENQTRGLTSIDKPLQVRTQVGWFLRAQQHKGYSKLGL